MVSSNPANSLGASLSTSVLSGTYYIAVHSSGGYGNLGTYSLSGTVPGGSGGGGGGPVAAPEISLAVSGTAVADGGTVSFGSTTVGTPVNRTITITNTGNAALSLGTINANSLPAGYSIVSNISTSSLAAGASTTFTLRLNATAAGTFNGSISFTNNDGDESPYDLQLSGSVNTAAAPPVVRYLDNGASGFTTSGLWFQSSGGRENDTHLSINGSGSNVATWTFSGLTAGQYRVSATWGASSVYASDAPFSVYNGTQLLGTSRQSQKVASSGFSDAGSNWKDLGNFTITGTTLVVKLANNANGWVSADAIRIEKIQSSNSSVAKSSGLDGALTLQSPAGWFAAPRGEASESQQATDLVFRDQGAHSWLQPPDALPPVTKGALGNGASAFREFTNSESAAHLDAPDLLDELAAHLARLRD
jgi:hypothetical protein